MLMFGWLHQWISPITLKNSQTSIRPNAKINTRHMLPMFQDKFGHVDQNHDHVIVLLLKITNFAISVQFRKQMIS